MDRAVIEPAIKCILSKIAARLANAAPISRAADICAASGNVTEEITISMEIDPKLHEAGRPMTPRR